MNIAKEKIVKKVMAKFQLFDRNKAVLIKDLSTKIFNTKSYKVSPPYKGSKYIQLKTIEGEGTRISGSHSDGTFDSHLDKIHDFVKSEDHAEVLKSLGYSI